MTIYSTQLSLSEIRECLDQFLPRPWIFPPQKHWKEAVHDISFTKPKAFSGSVGPGWFKLYVKPNGRAFVPTVYGTFKKSENTSKVTIEIGHLLQDLFSIIFTCLFLVVSLNALITEQDYFKGGLYLVLSIIILVVAQHQLKHYENVSLEKLTALLDLKLEPDTKKITEPEAPLYGDNVR